MRRAGGARPMNTQAWGRREEKQACRVRGALWVREKKAEVGRSSRSQRGQGLTDFRKDLGPLLSREQC